MADLPLIIAHRGASAVAPENTLAAFRRALADGADGVECDVRLARDGVPVLFHDAGLHRTTLREGKLSNLTSGELGRLDAGTWFNQKHPTRARQNYSREAVPTLAQLLELMRDAGDKLIYLEMKCLIGENRSLATAIAELIKHFRVEERVVVKSFHHNAVREVQKCLPKVRTAALFAPRMMRVLQPTRSLVEPALNLEADELSLHYTLATERTVQRANNAGMKTVIWTADHPAWVRRALKLGIYGIITNNPARLLARRKELMIHNKI